MSVLVISSHINYCDFLHQTWIHPKYLCLGVGGQESFAAHLLRLDEPRTYIYTQYSSHKSSSKCPQLTHGVGSSVKESRPLPCRLKVLLLVPDSGVPSARFSFLLDLKRGTFTAAANSLLPYFYLSISLSLDLSYSLYLLQRFNNLNTIMILCTLFNSWYYPIYTVYKYNI